MKSRFNVTITIVITVLFLAVGYLMLLQTGIIASVQPQKGEPKYSDNTGMSVILTFIGVVFTLFAFLTFQGVRDLFASEIKQLKDEEKKRAEKQEEQQKIHNDKFLVLENEINFQSSITLNTDALSAYEKGNYEETIELRFLECEVLSNMLINHTNTDENLENFKKRLSYSIKMMEYEISKHQLTQVRTFIAGKGHLKPRMDVISMATTDEEYIKLCKIVSLFVEPKPLF